MEFKRNRQAYRDYAHIETYDAGIVLTGAEVRSIKTGHIILDGSFIKIDKGEAWLMNAQIPLYTKASLQTRNSYDPKRNRKLLFSKREIASLAGKIQQKGLTLIPLFVYSSRRLVKVKVALAKGKRTFDKREAIKEREFKRRLNSRVRH